MHLILAGATGLVGSGVLDAMIKCKEITKISILSRRQVPMAEEAKDPRIHVIIQKDFNNYGSEVLNQLQGATGAVWALGISQTKVNKEEYIKITKDYALAAAEAFSHLQSESADQPFRFIYVSGRGATQTPSQFTALFGRVKGETETLLSAMRSPRLQTESVRPAGVDASMHSAILPYIPDPGLMYRIGGALLYPVVRAGFRGIHTPTEPLGRFLVDMAMGKCESQIADAAARGEVVTLQGGLRIVENSTFRKIAGLR